MNLMKNEYFVSGRSLPWWLAGTSMVATTFAADTPLAVTGLIANHGIAGNLAVVEYGDERAFDCLFLFPSLASIRCAYRC